MTDRVKILETKYDEEKDLFVWRIKFLHNSVDQSFCWPSVDLLSALGIKTESAIPPEYLHKFCEDMKGKEINFILEGEPVEPIEIGTDEELEAISDDVSSHFDNFRKHVEEGGS